MGRHTPAQTTTDTYRKAPRRTTSFPVTTKPQQTSTKINIPETTKPQQTSTKINIPEPTTTQPTPNKPDKPANRTKKITDKIPNDLKTPDLAAALTILLTGIILTGISWGWTYAAAVALVTLGFFTAYTILYTKNQ